MTFKNKVIVTILAAVLILGGIFAAGHKGVGSLGGAQLVENSNPIFTNGLRGGGVSTAIVQVVNSAGQWVGQLSTALSATFTGTTRVLSPIETGSKIILTGGVATTSVTASQICGASYIEWSPSVANATATLPTAASLTSACLTTTGDRLPYIVWKNTAATASTTLFAAGASTTVVYANASTTLGGVPSSLAGGSYASLRFFSSSSSDPTSGITVLISQFK